ncbi:MAG: hypothetical protein ABL921_11960 [Pirellula sp.]
MTINAAEIETIVRRVLSTLSTIDASALGSPASDGNSKSTGYLQVADRVVSVEALRGRLAGIQVLEILPTAVLTPAASDLCRERKIQIVREPSVPTQQSSSPVQSATRPPRLIVSGSATWIGSVAKQLCPKQSKVIDASIDDASAIRSISDGLRAGHQAGVAIVNAPHSACWQAARDDRLRPAVVSNWGELAAVLSEVPVNVLIISAKTWNVPSACNLARRMFEHLQKHS